MVILENYSPYRTSWDIFL